VLKPTITASRDRKSAIKTLLAPAGVKLIAVISVAILDFFQDVSQPLVFFHQFALGHAIASM